ncbi:MAG: molybdopterin-guanine dinucleotide biosynthesis protein MobB, partial [Gammaproteobacteria bacterium]
AAGAAQVMLSGRRRWVLMTEHGDAHDAPLDELVATMDLAALDLVLVEGFRRTALPRIEVHRATHVGAPLCRDDPTIIALASDATPRPAVAVPGFALDDVAAIAAFVVAHVAHVRLQRDDATA